MNYIKYEINFIKDLDNNLEFEDKIFDSFLEDYKNIILTDNTVPIFNNSTTKFIPHKNNKHSKKKYNIQSIFIRNSNAWSPNSRQNIDNLIK